MNAHEVAGIAHELRFWQGFVRTERFLKGWVAARPTPELQPMVRDFILERPHATVLDVGSGVVSILHGTARPELLHAVDPLGDLYGLIFDYRAHGLVQPTALSAEELAIDGEYDVVHISNAIDHCQDPATAVERLAAAVKPGGWLIVQGFENEGTHEGGAGLHQWDFRVHGNTLSAQPAGGDVLYASWVGTEVERLSTPQGRDWYIWKWQRPS